MEITVEMSGKTPRSYGGRTKWGVHPVGAPKDYWVDIYCTDRPKAGQVFNIGAVKETASADGAKIFREAEIIGPAGSAATRITPPVSGHGNAWPAPQTNKPAAPSTNGSAAPSNGQLFPSKGKIKWAAWCEMANAAYELSCAMDDGETDTYARMKFVNTTMMEYAKGNLELPSEAGPVSREPGDDDPYADPDSVLPPGWGETRV
jgi:hypothetical protein